ncbi:hypothetical protein D9M70_412060 [compost metagenome]
MGQQLAGYVDVFLDPAIGIFFAKQLAISAVDTDAQASPGVGGGHPPTGCVIAVAFVWCGGAIGAWCQA